MFTVKVLNAENNTPLKTGAVKIRKDNEDISWGTVSPEGVCTFGDDFELPFDVIVIGVINPGRATAKKVEHSFEIKEDIKEQYVVTLDFKNEKHTDGPVKQPKQSISASPKKMPRDKDGNPAHPSNAVEETK